MKKLLYILICLPLIFSSCKKEDDSPNSGSTNNTSGSGSIVGSWDFTEYHDIYDEGYYLGGYPNGTKITTSSQDEIMLPGDTDLGVQSANWTFSTDGYLTSNVIYIDGFNEAYNRIYEKNGNTLTIDTNDI